MAEAKKKRAPRKKTAATSKKKTKAAAKQAVVSEDGLKTTAELKNFLTAIREQMDGDDGAPMYAASALNSIFRDPMAYDLMNTECKEIARDNWLRLKQAGLNLRNPPMLFDEAEAEA